VPLSDAARALLASRRPGATPPPDAKPAKPAADDPAHQGFRDRAAREEERFRLATDSEYWICLCFRTETSATRFASLLGLAVTGRYTPGPGLAQVAGGRGPLTGAERTRMLLRLRAERAAALTAARTPGARENPLARVPLTDDLAADSAAELAALHTALNSPRPDAPADVLDSPHWIAAYWASRDDKDAFLEASGLEVLGDKYLDGHQAAALLGLDL
jgi:hypothetical protein